MIYWFLLIPATVPACVPVFLFIMISWFLVSGKGFCSIMISWFLWFRLGFRGLFSCFSFLCFLKKGMVFHHDFLVPSGSGSSSGACLLILLCFLFSGKKCFSIMISWFRLVPAQVPGLVSSFCFAFFSQERNVFP